ncbi:hypothetical protein M513_03159 [Trichuris suis]|uniref:ADP-ribose pyrophosphatase, mitochondrial n=1 Tax=Trichuris suis TaxID=68888 RepID=A0A085MFN9_9BILA|nr:hypothetical protein M513_03159 [Trichuris suis]
MTAISYMEQLFLVIFLFSYKWLLSQPTYACSQSAMPERIEVPEELVPWRQPFSSYHPPYWTAPCSFRYCDPEVNSTLEIRFNKKDRGIDRRMVRRLNGVKVYYKVREGLPLNPLGRTGIAGRGYLPRWGPTHLVKVILVRKRHGHLKMEYLATKDKLTFTDDVFSNFVDKLSSRKLSQRVIDAVRNSSQYRNRSEVAEKVLYKAEENAIKVVADTMPSPLDTDNAWIELSVYVIPCGTCKRFCNAIMEDREIAMKYKWSHRADNQTFFEMLRSLEKLDEAKTNSLNHRITFRRYVHRPYRPGYKREVAFAVALMGLYGIGIGFFIAGIAVPAIGFIVGAIILGLTLSLMTFVGRCYYE